MGTRFQKAVIGFVLIFSIGLHWPILQSVAWMNMLVVYAQDEGLEQAVVKTFDGKNACDLCAFVAEGKKKEEKSSREVSLKKFDFARLDSPAMLLPSTILSDATPFLRIVALRLYPPLTPPPNAA